METLIKCELSSQKKAASSFRVPPNGRLNPPAAPTTHPLRQSAPHSRIRPRLPANQLRPLTECGGGKKGGFFP